MYVRVCDSCQQRTPDDDELTVGIQLRRKRLELCARCSGGIIEMLKDMRLIKERDTSR